MYACVLACFCVYMSRECQRPVFREENAGYLMPGRDLSGIWTTWQVRGELRVGPSGAGPGIQLSFMKG